MHIIHITPNGAKQEPVRFLHGFGSAYLPTVWLASCRIRLNCFFILNILR